MDKITTVLEIIVPIFITIILGMFAKRKNMITEDENKGCENYEFYERTEKTIKKKSKRKGSCFIT